MNRRIVLAGNLGWLALALLVMPVRASERISPGDWVRVLYDSPAKIETEVVGTIPGGTVAEVKYVQDDWVFLEVGKIRGWVRRSRVEKVSSPEPVPVLPPPIRSPAEPAMTANSGTTLALLSGYMDQLGYKYFTVTESREEEGMIISLFSLAEAELQLTIFIDPIVEKGCLLFKAPRVLHAPVGTTSPDRLLELLKAIGYINYSIILGKFCYDPRDGEVSFEVNIPIDDSAVTFGQFKHCLIVLLGELEEKVPKLRRILAGEATADVFIHQIIIQPAQLFTTGTSSEGQAVGDRHSQLVGLRATPRAK
jgi:hypothetical protein